MVDSIFSVDAGRQVQAAGLHRSGAICDHADRGWRARWAAGALAAQAGQALGKSDRDAQRVLGPILRRVGYGINHLDDRPQGAPTMNQCGCNDWQMTHRRTMLRRQGQVVPIPRAVLEGESAGICRRDFLRNGAVAFLTVYGASMMSWNRIWEAAAAQAATPSTDPIIVSIFL